MTKLIFFYLLVLLVGCAPPTDSANNSTVAKLRAKAQAGQTVEPAEIAATAQPVSVQAVPLVEVQSSDGLTPDSAGLVSGLLFGAALGLPFGYMVAVYIGNRPTLAQPAKAVKRG